MLESAQFGEWAQKNGAPIPRGAAFHQIILPVQGKKQVIPAKRTLRIDYTPLSIPMSSVFFSTPGHQSPRMLNAPR